MTDDRAQQAREHLQAILRDPKRTIKGLWRDTGISPKTIRNILDGSPKPTTSRTIDRILAIPGHAGTTPPRPGCVEAAPTRQRLQLMYDLGYTHTEIGDAVGISSKAISKILRRDQETVSKRTHELVRATPLPPARAEVRAKRLHPNPELVAEHLNRLRDEGHRWTEISHATGVTVECIADTALGKNRPTVANANALLAYDPPPNAARLARRKPAPPEPEPAAPEVRKERPWGEVRRAVVAHYRRGHSPEQIATALNLPPQRVRDALLSVGGPRTRSASWPPAGHMAAAHTRGRAA